MSIWIEAEWFRNVASTMREAVADALSLIEDPACRLQTDAFLRAAGLHKHPETLPGRQLVTELGKAMTRDRLQGQTLAVYEGLYLYLPPLRQIHDALSSTVLHENVAIPPTPPVIVDARIPAKDFWETINEQVFIIPVDD